MLNFLKVQAYPLLWTKYFYSSTLLSQASSKQLNDNLGLVIQEVTCPDDETSINFTFSLQFSVLFTVYNHFLNHQCTPFYDYPTSYLQLSMKNHIDSREVVVPIVIFTECIIGHSNKITIYLEVPFRKIISLDSLPDWGSNCDFLENGFGQGPFRTRQKNNSISDQNEYFQEEQRRLTNLLTGREVWKELSSQENNINMEATPSFFHNSLERDLLRGNFQYLPNNLRRFQTYWELAWGSSFVIENTKKHVNLIAIKDQSTVMYLIPETLIR